jgi:cytochrome c553
MSTDRLFSARNPWFLTAAGLTVLVAVVSAAVGFVWLPSLRPGGPVGDLWNEICSAAGLIRPAPEAQPPVPATYKTTDVVLTPNMLAGAGALSIGRGGTLALQCTMCHGARGISEADSPNLAGQYGPVIFKQLRDYRSGARVNAIMSPRAKDLTDQDITDLAAYYAYLPRLPGYHPSGEPAPAIVVSGAPMRNIPPCAACHGGLAAKLGSPWLEGESPVYLRTQLEAFAAGTRHNDISEQMRNIARNMTPTEIGAASRYYASQP